MPAVIRLTNQPLQNKAFCTILNFPRCTPAHDLYTIFSFLYVYGYVTKLCRQQAKVVQSHENEHVHCRGQSKAKRGKYTRLKLGGSQAYDCSSI
jgi:hypothetical protein